MLREYLITAGFELPLLLVRHRRKFLERKVCIAISVLILKQQNRILGKQRNIRCPIFDWKCILSLGLATAHNNVADRRIINLNPIRAKDRRKHSCDLLVDHLLVEHVLVQNGNPAVDPRLEKLIHRELFHIALILFVKLGFRIHVTQNIHIQRSSAVLI